MTKKRLTAAQKAVASIQAKLKEKQSKRNLSYVRKAQPGCHVAHNDAPWIIGTEKLDDVDCPDISIDPLDHALSVCNISKTKRSFNLSFEYTMVDAEGRPFDKGVTRNEDGEEKECTTLVLVVPPCHIMDIGFLELPDGLDIEDVVIDSDIKDVFKHEDPDKFDERDTYPFPLVGERFLCTQGFNGAFTHYFPGTYHAIDLACDIGTPVVAIGPGVVVEVQDSNTASGIHTANLYKWNLIALGLDNGSYVEYVHIKAGSAVVKDGDRVLEGQVICQSGDVGFCPTAHLHIQVCHSKEPDAPTVRFAFRDSQGRPYLPEAGKWYSCEGLVE